MKLIFVVAGAILVSTTGAHAYPAQCTSQFGYSAKCCAASYGRKAEGAMDNGQRHAELAACTAKAGKK